MGEFEATKVSFEGINGRIGEFNDNVNTQNAELDHKNAESGGKLAM